LPINKNTGSQAQFVFSAWKNEVAHTVASQHKLKAAGPTLDEITNRVFEELLQGKGAENTHTSDHGSIKVQNLKFSTFFAVRYFAWVNEKYKQHFSWKPQGKYY
jgi:hypothetical protein